MRKTWKQKLEGAPAPHVEETRRAFAGIPPGAQILISSPNEIREFIAGIPRGLAMSVAELRAALAKRHKVEFTCPLTTGIFLRIVSEAALDELDEGASVDKITPFWRAVGPKDAVAKKLRCGPEFIQERRAAEGI